MSELQSSDVFLQFLFNYRKFNHQQCILLLRSNEKVQKTCPVCRIPIGKKNIIKMYGNGGQALGDEVDELGRHRQGPVAADEDVLDQAMARIETLECENAALKEHHVRCFR